MYEHMHSLKESVVIESNIISLKDGKTIKRTQLSLDSTL